MRPTRVRTLIEKQRSKQGAHDMERWNMCMLHLHVMCIAVCCMLVACACACACMCITCACACCMYVHVARACMHVARACMCMCLGHRHSCWGRDLTPRHRVAAEERYSVPNGVLGGEGSHRIVRALRAHALGARALCRPPLSKLAALHRATSAVCGHATTLDVHQQQGWRSHLPESARLAAACSNGVHRLT